MQEIKTSMIITIRCPLPTALTFAQSGKTPQLRHKNSLQNHLHQDDHSTGTVKFPIFLWLCIAYFLLIFLWYHYTINVNMHTSDHLKSSEILQKVTQGLQQLLKHDRIPKRE